ncbi:Hypothetical protein R9X50_00587800 [Acrodontium crateriforme]|uniref:Serine/threonine-protein phosphatase 4 regulatory subunit 3-like central domain-containing protein n=1 Tax=Acrodontium crateriforme TaxID=150365 RepID=A0AAQ3M7E1_9PEZI|nr:Hypothetical protein R9X50_00587800 [Acrodontium crateriforme]
MAQAPSHERRRVKVYELKNNDWYDRGTGFCGGTEERAPDGTLADPYVARLLVYSEDDTERALLETQIGKDDGYQKQQDTLIVWTEPSGVDMALSFQEADGCQQIWDFVSQVKNHLEAMTGDLADDMLEAPLSLPEPHLGKLDHVENAIRNAATTQGSREEMIKFIMNPESNYILKLTPLVTMAEDLESLPDLHRMCNIMKHLILLNDTSIIEFIVTDPVIMGVVGALEYDPDFPSHRANHRQYLSDSSKYKEVVKIEDDDIRRKIHYVYRLQYLKDVVLARILDDPTFGVLNSLIFYNQVSVLSYLQNDETFMPKLFAIFDETHKDGTRKKDGVLFIQNCCAISKNIQQGSRQMLFTNFIQHGLFPVITFALRHFDSAVRVAGTDILVSLIDHDPYLVRNHIFTAIKENTTPLTETLIELLLVEVDLGVKSQMADAIKILLDPSVNNVMDAMNRQANTELAPGKRPVINTQHPNAPQTDAFIQSFYDASANRLFAPLKALQHRPSMNDLTVHETSLFTHLVEILCFFVRQHTYKSKLFILSENMHSRVAELLRCPQKHMKLTALKWFRTCVGLQDEFHNRHMIQAHLLEPILTIVEETMPRDNLLNSACLELFEYIKRENVKQLIVYLAENHRDRMVAITYVNTFHELISKYDELQGVYGPPPAIDDTSFTTQEGTPREAINGGQRFHGLKEDESQDAYFEGDDDDDDEGGLPTTASKHPLVNGASPIRPLVNYPLDEDEDAMDILASPLRGKKGSNGSSDPTQPDSNDTESDGMEVDRSRNTENDRSESDRGRSRAPVPLEGSPGNQLPESVLMKRRREEDDDDDDELGKMMTGSKRRSSSASLSSQTGKIIINSNGPSQGSCSTEHANAQEDESESSASQRGNAPGHGHMLRRKGSLKAKNEPARHGRFSTKATSAVEKKASATESTAEKEETTEPVADEKNETTTQIEASTSKSKG